MKTYMPLNGLRWSRNSGSANCDMPQSAVFGRPGGGIVLPGKGHHVKKDKDIRNSPLSNVLLISKLNKTNQNEWSKDIS